MNKIIALILLTHISCWTFGQTCGTTPSARSNARASTLELVAVAPGTSFCIDIYFHIVRRTNGSSAFPIPDTQAITFELNKHFSKHGITFNSMGYRFINNSELLDISGTEYTREKESGFFSWIYGRTDALNYFIVDKIISGAFAGFALDVPSNNLFIDNDYVNGSVSAHEVGHCVGLHHTFHGSSAEQLTGSCPEDINGDNCEVCGDYVCDTPADTNEGRIECEELGQENCPYRPDMNNIMSYYDPGNTDNFTSGQGERMRQIIASHSMFNSLISNSCPRLSDIVSVCHSDTPTVTLLNGGGASVANWTSSTNIKITSSNGSSATFKRISNSTYGMGWISAKLNNNIELKDEFIIPQQNPETMSGPTNVGNGSWETYRVNGMYGANSYTWILPSTWSFHPTTNRNSNEVLLNVGSKSGYVRVRSNNACGWSNHTSKYVTVNGGGCSGPICEPFTIYPNPSSTSIRITLDSKGSEVEYKLYNLNNKLLKSERINSDENIDLSSYKKGIYLIRIQKDDEWYTHQVIKK